MDVGDSDRGRIVRKTVVWSSRTRLEETGAFTPPGNPGPSPATAVKAPSPGN
jgi:hypothetical protein